jgi:hypothetical protein
MALALAHKSAAKWAREEKVTPGHLSQVLDGRESKRLIAKIDAFTVHTFKAHRVRAA